MDNSVYNYISFNNNGSHFAVGTNDGIKIFETNTAKKLLDLRTIYQ